MHDLDSPIAFFDSGVGGLPYLEAARRLLPDERFVYLADRAGFPYGTKSPERVRDLAVGAIRALVAKTAPKAVVIACNTATELAVDAIRADTPGLIVVGTVPAIKPAAALSRVRRIGVVATEAAVAADYLTGLASAWAADCELVRIGDAGLVDFVERRLLGSTRDERLRAVAPSVRAMLERGVDVIVLGGTHFLQLSEEFGAVAGPGVSIVDSRDGVAARLASRLDEEGLRGSVGARRTGGCPDRRDAESDRPGEPSDRLFLTGAGDPGPVYGGFAERFGLSWAGCLP